MRWGWGLKGFLGGRESLEMGKPYCNCNEGFWIFHFKSQFLNTHPYSVRLLHITLFKRQQLENIVDWSFHGNFNFPFHCIIIYTINYLSFPFLLHQNCFFLWMRKGSTKSGMKYYSCCCSSLMLVNF